MRNRQDGLKMAGYLLAGLLALVLIMVFGAWRGFLMPVFFLSVLYGEFYLLRGFSREYEYTVTNGELDIDLIVAQRQRKRVFSGTARQFESMSPWGRTASENLAGQASQSLPVIDCRGNFQAGATAGNRIHYQIVTDYNGKRVRVLFTPDEFIVNQMKKFNPARVMIG